jgi:xanthine dehydrogenase accessory factor
LRARLRAPVGLDIGGRTPEAIALSIVGEVQAALSGRGGRPFTETAVANE